MTKIDTELFSFELDIFLYQGPIIVTAEILWLGLGILAQALFMGRFLVQWIASEKAGRSVIPMAFWYLSILGGALLFIYAIHRAEPVFAFGQATGLLIYMRNIYFMSLEKYGQQTKTQEATAWQTWQWAFILIIAVVSWRIAVLVVLNPPLYGDEAQYWSWAQDLAFGYYSKPPMVAAAIAFTTTLCGDGEACVRLASPLAYIISALMLYALAARLFGNSTALMTALIFITLPGVSLSSMLISTDPLLLMFWSIGLYCAWRALSAGQWHWWIATGMALGFGLLTKYTMIAFAGSLFLALLWRLDSGSNADPAAAILDRKEKPWPRFCVCLAIALIIVMPNLIWNIQTGFVTFGHIVDNVNIGGPLLRPHKLFEFLGGQFAVFGPILFGILLWLIIMRWRGLCGHAPSKFLIMFTLPLLGVISCQALLSRAHANWAVAAYIAGTILVVGWIARLGWRPLLQASIFLHLLVAAYAYHGSFLAKWADITLPTKIDPINRLRGWDKFGEILAQQLSNHPTTRLLFTDRMTMATALYYGGPTARTALKWSETTKIGDHYDMVAAFDRTEDVPIGSDFIFVDRFGLPAAAAAAFESHQQLPDILIPLYGPLGTTPPTKHTARHFQVYLLRSYRGRPPVVKDTDNARTRQ